MAPVVHSLPRTGRLEVDIKVSADVNVSAYAARRKVDAFALSEMSCMMHAGEPELVLSERAVVTPRKTARAMVEGGCARSHLGALRTYWRVPIVLSLTSRGDVGQVGTVDVDVETGQMRVGPQLVAEMISRAESLALGSASAPAE